MHRDVKPANVLLGGDGTVQLADFGIAALADPDATVDDRLLGTLSYMAPETCRGERPAAPADVWAAGVLLYEALTGANPFRARTPDELLERHAAPAPARSARCAPTCRAAGHACMRARSRANPRRRPTALALRDALAGRRGPARRAGRRAAELKRRRPKPSCGRGGAAPELPPSNVTSLRELPRPSAARPVTSLAASAPACAPARRARRGARPADLVQRAEAVAVRLGRRCSPAARCWQSPR